MQNRPGKFQSELARASSDLKDQESKLQQTRDLLQEKKNERSGIDSQRHMLERTGDINRLMAMKQRGLALDIVARLLTSPNLRLEAVDEPMGALAARLAAEYALRGADAIYVATALRLGLPLVSLDQQQLAGAQAVVTVISP